MTRCQFCGALWRGPHQCRITYEQLAEENIMLKAQLEAMQHELDQARHCSAAMGGELLEQIREGSEIMEYLRDMASPTHGMDLTDQELLTFVRGSAED